MICPVRSYLTEVTDEAGRDTTGDPEDAIWRDVFSKLNKLNGPVLFNFQIYTGVGPDAHEELRYLGIRHKKR